jgi:hypothetical protein
MQDLIQRWKTTQGSIKADKRTSAPNSSKKNKYDFSSSSEDESPNKNSKYAVSLKRYN